MADLNCCPVPRCQSPAGYGGVWCFRHRRILENNGLISRVVPREGCWRWPGRAHGNGYGYIQRGESTAPAHRFVYELLVGPIPDGLQIDHLCRNTMCVNPSHLEPVTQVENIRRGVTSRLGGVITAETCRFGHSDMQTLPSGRRQCRACNRLRSQRWREQRKHPTWAASHD